jgi:hypothetical protein
MITNPDQRASGIRPKHTVKVGAQHTHAPCQNLGRQWAMLLPKVVAYWCVRSYEIPGDSSCCFSTRARGAAHAQPELQHVHQHKYLTLSSLTANLVAVCMNCQSTDFPRKSSNCCCCNPQQLSHAWPMNCHYMPPSAGKLAMIPHATATPLQPSTLRQHMHNSTQDGMCSTRCGKLLLQLGSAADPQCSAVTTLQLCTHHRKQFHS